MDDESKLEKEESRKGSGGKFAGAIAAALFSGVVIGLVTGVLFAPKKGQKTRKEIADKSKDLVERSKKTFTGTIDKTKEFTREGKSKLDRVINIITPKKKSKQN